MSKTHEESVKYQDSMDIPMANLAVAMWGFTGKGPEGLKDHEIVEIAARKIAMLKKMILATEFSEKMLNAVMEE